MKPATRVFIIFSTGYFLSYLFRTVNAVLAPDLVATFGLSAADLGLMTALYFNGFAAMQPALGILLDGFGPRRIQGLLLLVAGTGAICFATAESRMALFTARTLIGIGVSGCLMSALKGSVLWFPRGRLPLVNAGMLTAGGLGAVVAATPVTVLAQHTGWRGVFLVLALFTFALVAATWFAAPEQVQTKSGQSLSSQLRGIGEVVRAPIFIRLAPAFAAAQGGFLALHGLWAGAWLREAAGLDRLTVSYYQVAMSITLTLGFLCSGVAADRLARRGVPPLTVAVAGMIGLVALESAIAASPPLETAWLWPVASFVAAFVTVGFAVINQTLPPELSARAATSLNLVMFTTAFALQYGFGAALDLWPRADLGTHPLGAWRSTLGMLIFIQASTILWFWLAGRIWQARLPAKGD